MEGKGVNGRNSSKSFSECNFIVHIYSVLEWMLFKLIF